MSWFDEQIKERKLNDNEIMSQALGQVAASVLGTKKASKFLEDNNESLSDSVSRILKYYHIKYVEIEEEFDDVNEELEFRMRPYGIMRRSVELSENWDKEAFGPLLGSFAEDDSMVALIPGKVSGYTFFNSKTGKNERVSRKNRELFDRNAICFYRPFPNRKIDIKDLLIYIFRTYSFQDFIWYVILTLICTLIGMLLPKFDYYLLGTVVTTKTTYLLWVTAVFLGMTTLSSTLFNIAKNMHMNRISTKLDLSVESATMMRILSLSPDFFDKFSSGELSKYSTYISSLCNVFVDSIFSVGITSLMSLLYIGSIFKYAPSLVVPSLIIIITTTVFSIITSLVQMNISEKSMKLSAKTEGIAYSLISGVQKIKLAGAEKRAFSKWAQMYSQEAALTYSPPTFIKINGVIFTIISLAGNLITYYIAIKTNVSPAQWFAFQAALAVVSGAFSSFSGTAISIATIRPVLNMAKPIMDACPEISEGKEVIREISGRIEINNLSFRYNDNSPYVLDDISLSIKPGQYVAIVGKTGCGKSTLVKLILGFVKPQKGTIYFDGKDIERIDLRSLRRKIGTVIQNGKLFQGDIYSNITICAPWLTLDEAWEAARLAGIDEDIENMPMGMSTYIGEGQGGISGGQRQRLMIARAIAPKPKVLIFDEATSALDNITQKRVSDSLDSLKCTRIVVAHRLSTIKHCDRIVVLDKGKIIEDGTYDELIKNNGFFAELVERQRIDER